MTNMSEEEKIAWVVAAAAQLRVAAVPQRELWPTILGRLEVQGTHPRRAMPWITFVIVVALLLISGTIISAKIAEYRSANSRAAAAADPLRSRLYRAEKITSEHDKSVALIALVQPAKADTGLARLIIKAARPISSSFEKSNVLVELAKRGAISTVPLRASYLDAAETISSKAERERALDALDRSASGGRPFFRPDELTPRR